MTLENLTKEELDALEVAVKNSALRKMLEARIDYIQTSEWERDVVSREDLLRLSQAKGMVYGFRAVLTLGQAIKEERDLREKELEKEKKK